MGWYAHLQGIFPAQEMNMFFLHLLHWQAGSLPLVPPVKPSAIWLLGMYVAKGNEIGISKRNFYSHIYCSFVYKSQDMETS